MVNFLYQPTLENKLEALLDRYRDVEVRRAREVVDFTQDADGVSVVHAASTGASYGEQRQRRGRRPPGRPRARATSWLPTADAAWSGPGWGSR